MERMLVVVFDKESTKFASVAKKTHEIAEAQAQPQVQNA